MSCSLCRCKKSRSQTNIIIIVIILLIIIMLIFHVVLVVQVQEKLDQDPSSSLSPCWSFSMYSCIPPSHPRCAGAREANQEQNSADSDWAGYLLHISRGNFVLIVMIIVFVIIFVMIIMSPIESAIFFTSSKVTFVIIDKLARWLDTQDVLVIGLVVVITWCHWCLCVLSFP